VGEARRFGLFPRKGSKAAYVYRPAPCTKEVLWPDGSVTKDAWISRLGRDLSGSFGSTAYAREELVAELAASLICQRLQIGSDLASHAVTARKDDAPAAHQAALAKVADRGTFSSGGGLIHITSG
jgi:hypothetical protein